MSGADSSTVEPLDAVDVIRIKRDKGEVPEEALRWMIDAYTREYVADSQMAAFAMAVLLNGMTRDEIRVMTDAMIASGERMSFSSLGKRTVDKHSTGGVGDKITLPLAPLVASFGVAVPQLSGRGLGHTGGTLDKLESIPGWRAALSNEEMFAQLQGVGAVICAAGSGLAPADKRLYALRDVTGMVEAIPQPRSRPVAARRPLPGDDAYDAYDHEGRYDDLMDDEREPIAEVHDIRRGRVLRSRGDS